MKRLAFLTSRFQWQGQASAVRAAAKGFGADVVDLPVDLPTSEADYRGAIAKAKGEGADAILVGDNPDIMTNRALIAGLVAQAGWPAIYPFAEFVEAGGLMAYSFDLGCSSARPTTSTPFSQVPIRATSRFIRPPNSNCRST